MLEILLTKIGINTALKNHAISDLAYEFGSNQLFYLLKQKELIQKVGSIYKLWQG